MNQKNLKKKKVYILILTKFKKKNIIELKILNMRLISVTNNLDLVNFKIKFNHRQGSFL